MSSDITALLFGVLSFMMAGFSLSVNLRLKKLESSFESLCVMHDRLSRAFVDNQIETLIKNAEDSHFTS